MIENFDFWIDVSGLKRFSDLDLVVWNEEDKHTQLGKLRDAFEGFDLPIKVDLSEWNQLPDWLKQEILEEYAVLQEPVQTTI